MTKVDRYKKIKTSDNKKLVKLSRMCKEYVKKLKVTNGTQVGYIPSYVVNFTGFPVKDSFKDPHLEIYLIEFVK